MCISGLDAVKKVVTGHYFGECALKVLFVDMEILIFYKFQNGR